MYRIALFLLLMPLAAGAQWNVSLQAGFATQKLSTQSSSNYYIDRGATPKPVFALRATTPIGKRFELGGDISHQQNAIVVHTVYNTTLGRSLENTSKYIFLSPVAGVSLGPKNIFRFYAIPQIGLAYERKEKVGYNLVSVKALEYGYADVAKTDKNVSPVLFRLGLEAEQQFPLTNDIRVVLNEGYSRTLNKITKAEMITETGSVEKVSIKPSVISIRFGVTYTFHKSKKKPQEAPIDLKERSNKQE